MRKKAIKIAVAANIRAMIIPHLFGIPGDIQKLVDTGIPIIEDISHSFGSKIDDKFTGTFGKVAVSSFSNEMIITTFKTTFKIGELEEYLNMHGRTYIVRFLCDVMIL